MSVERETGPVATKNRGSIFRNHWVKIAACLPALATAAGAIAFALATSSQSDQEITERYLREAKLRRDAKDDTAAGVYYERLVQLSPDTPEFRYGLAQSLAAVGQTGRARAILGSLMPAEGPGYAPAHLWESRRLLQGSNHSPQDLKAAERHLLRAMETQPDDSDANALLGRLYIATGRTEKAEPYLTKAAKDQPDLLFLLTKVDSALGRPDGARHRAELALKIFRTRAESSPDNLEARVSWAAAAMLLQDFPGAERILQQGLSRVDDPRYHKALAGLYAAQSDALAKEPAASLGDRLALLERGLKHDPADVGTIARLSAILRTNDKEAERGRSSLRALLAGGKGTEIVHFALGIDAWERGKTDEAKLHWEQALQLAPHMAAAANNLAWLLAHVQPPDLPRALTLANQVLESWPDRPTFRGTRGMILAKMQRWKEALPDLEAALKSDPDGVDLHRVLAETYDQLGDKEMAAEHRRKVGTQPGTKP